MMRQFRRYYLPVFLLAGLGLILLPTLLGLPTLFSPIVLKAQPAAVAGEPKTMAHMSVGCHWLPQAQFAGYYMAREKGFYRQAGLAVDIVHAGAMTSNVDMLEKNQVEFASLFLSTAVRLRTDGADLVNIGQLFRHSSLILAARKSAGIKELKDLNGKRIGIWRSDFRDAPLQFLRQQGIHADIVFMNASIDLFLWGGVDAMLVTSYNELHTLRMCGVTADELRLFPLKNYGLDIPEDGIYCREKFYRAHPDLCRRFMSATMEGWHYAATHQEETLDTMEKIMHDNHLPFARCHQRWMLEKSLALIYPDGINRQVPDFSPVEYAAAVKLLEDAGRIKTAPSFAVFARPVGPEGRK